MALGVLNNLSAIYAENNLNNTSNSLQKVLQQLSSGSKINSGADDSAGLSLVNGLEANATALAQSETNSTEGVGLLQVADGALSQVTNLLDRAITLATEASNGTLNTSQEAAANQEYSSILSEINNIGSTTTYNQEQVFTGNKVAIFTGDSSSQGSSIDQLNIHTLSSATVGDTGGAMSYASGQSNDFIDLSGTTAGVTTNASSTDSLGGTSTSITVNYLTQGAGGSAITSTAVITAGAGTSYNNTVQGLITAINDSGLGLNATFATSGVAGDAAELNAGVLAGAALGTKVTTDTGILIGGQNVGIGTNEGVVASLVTTNSTDVLGGTLTIGGNAPINLTTGAPGGGAFTTGSLEAYINAGSFGVTASVDAVTGDLDLLSANSSLVVTSTTFTVGGAAGVVNTPLSTTTPYYSTGLITAGATTVTDTTTGGGGVINNTAATVGVADVNGTSSTATISYSDGAGEDLSGTDLLSQSNAQAALTSLATAITDVAAMDGYIGAQINTLNSVSQVMNTQAENVTSAQNAIQATDYAAATAAMSKYEILSQTGIAALAQANTVQQEVTKLLQ